MTMRLSVARALLRSLSSTWLAAMLSSASGMRGESGKRSMRVCCALIADGKSLIA